MNVQSKGEVLSEKQHSNGLLAKIVTPDELAHALARSDGSLQGDAGIFRPIRG